MKINRTMIFLLSSAFLSRSLALDPPKSLVDDTISSEDRELFFFYNRRCTRKLDACWATVGDDGLPLGQWVVEIDQIGGDDSELLKNHLYDIVDQAQKTELDFEAGDDSPELELKNVIKVMIVLLKLRLGAKSIALLEEDDDIASAALALYDSVTAATDELATSLSREGIVDWLLTLALLVLLVVLSPVIFVASIIAAVGSLIFLVGVIVFSLLFGASQARACPSDLLRCEYEKFVLEIVPSLLEISSMLATEKDMSFDHIP
jgi:hypothetical protein